MIAPGDHLEAVFGPIVKSQITERTSSPPATGAALLDATRRLIFLRGLIEKILKDPSYRERAAYFQKVISKTRGLDVAADIIEQAFHKYQTEVPRDSRSVARGNLNTAEEMQEA
jgi:hypothetical protein